VSIPEVSSRSRLLAFLKNFFAESRGTYVTTTAENGLPNESVITAGDNITFDTTVPNVLTIDASGGGGGDVSVSGTPSNNQVPTWTNATTIQGESNLTFDGSTLDVNGDVDIASGQYLRTNGIAAVGSSGNEVQFGSAAVDKTLALRTDIGTALSIDAAGVVTFDVAPAEAGGADNTVLIINSSSEVIRDEIDSRVWGSTLVDASSGASTRVGVFSDSNTIAGSAELTYDGSIFLVSDAAAELQVVDTSLNYIITLLPSNGPKIQFGDTDSSNDSFMTIGAYGGINNIDTEGRDFHLFGTNTTTGLYFDESDGTFGIGTTAPQVELHVCDSNGAPQIRLSDTDASIDQQVVAYIEYYRGSNTNRIGWCGYGSTTTQDFTVTNQTATGSFEVKTNNTTAFTVDYQGNTTVVGDLTVTGGDITLGASTSYIRDAGGDARILFPDTGNTVLQDSAGVGRLTVGTTAITVHHDLIVLGNDIIDSGYAAAITFDGSQNTTITGDLTVTGNDIKNSADLTTITMNADGSITNPLQPMVYAFRNSTQDLSPDTSWETVIFNDESTTNDTAFDVGSDYNTSTGYFTAPADGKYLISVEVMLTNVPASSAYILLNLITTKGAADGISQYSGRVNPGSWDAEMDYYQIAGTWLTNMSSGDTAYVQIRNTNADADTKIYGASTTTYTRIQIMKVA